MTKNKIIGFILLFWISGWVYIGINQIPNSIKLITTQQSEASSIHGVGYKVIKKNGTKFLIKDRDIENTEKQIIPVQDDQCLAEELLAQINHEFNYKNNQLHLSFGESSPEDYGIHNLSIKLEPDWQYGKNNETLHNIYTVNLPTNQKEVSLPLNIYKTQNMQSISLLLTGSGKTSYLRDCLTSEVTRINTERVENFTTLKPYFSHRTVKNIYMKQPFITENTEDSFIREHMNYQQERLKFESLPQPHEAAVALLRKDITKNTENDNWEWKDIRYGALHKRNEETVIGFYGDVRNSDLVLLSNLIDALTIVIPDLRIRYSNDHSQVNLPIHISPCSEEVDTHIGCKDEYSGAYFSSDWIFIDGNNSKDFRKYVIVHELGHALGLGHNLCRDSAMSYADYSDHLPFFSHVDLMQLQVLYAGKTNIISGNNLDEERVKYYQEDISEACSVKDSGWLKLINMQLGITR